MTTPALARTVSGYAALKTAAANPNSRFAYAENNPASAGWRLAQAAPVRVQSTPKFRLSAEDVIFTMGSCFARNVEESLIRLGIKVSLADFDFPREFFDPNYGRLNTWVNTSLHGNLIRSVLNKYTPLSMLNEFERLLRPERFADPYKGLIQVDPDRWFDPHIKNTRMMSRAECLVARSLVEEATARVHGATTIFLTLGFTETWLDSQTGYILNVAPSPFYNETHSDVLASLREIHALVTQHIRPDMKFVVTVSPVPLGTTFTAMDIISANAYSKATLRSAVGEFCAERDNVDYYPSYEMVTATDPKIAWQEDRIHVTVPLVDAVIGHFVEHYFDAPALEKMAASAAPGKMAASAALAKAADSAP
jgi:hypothetical protein